MKFKMELRKCTLTNTEDMKINGGPWRLDSIIAEHNHPMDLDIKRFAEKITPEMTELIQDCADANIKTEEIVKLLNVKYPDKFIRSKTVSNTKSKFKIYKQPEVNKAVEMLCLLKQWKQEDDDWYIDFELGDGGQLQKVFWMSPLQRKLYCMYDDVVINDTTAGTNMFNIPFNVTVIIDADGVSRVAACALICSEESGDYEWILTRLLQVGKKPPNVLVVDEDKAMRSAYKAVFGESTRIVGCIWHFAGNIPKNLSKLSSDEKSRWENFKIDFWRARDSVTTAQFDMQWKLIMEKYGFNNERLRDYLMTLCERRYLWAKPWVGTIFTAGTQSTQRVEKTHHVLKNIVHRKSTLVDILTAIEKKLEREVDTQDYLRYKGGIEVQKGDVESLKYFSAVVAVNARYLGMFGTIKMKREMCTSLYYGFRVSSFIV